MVSSQLVGLYKCHNPNWDPSWGTYNSTYYPVTMSPDPLSRGFDHGDDSELLSVFFFFFLGGGVGLGLSVIRDPYVQEFRV